MRKELLHSLLQREWIRDIYEDWIIKWFRMGLKPEGKPYYDDFIAKLQKGERVFLSNYANMFLGFDQESGIKGLENLQGLEDKPILVIANHTNSGPIAGGWKNVILSYHIQKTARNEIRLMHGFDPTARHDLFRERLYKSINSVPIRDPDPSRAGLSLRQAINNRDSMCLYPEGGFGSRDHNLRQGASEAGRLIKMCDGRDYAIVTASMRFKNDTFFAGFDRIGTEEIAGIDGADKNTLGQNVVDYAMRRIAQHLPPDYQGYYKKS